VALAALTVLGALGPGSVPGGSRADLRVLLATPSASALSAGTNATFCNALLSSSSLNDSVDAAYAELASSDASSVAVEVGSHASGPGLGGYPSKDDAAQIVQGWWTSVCLSPDFAGAIGQWGSGNFTWSSEVASTGALWQFAIVWVTGCTIPQVGSYTGCRFVESWNGNLLSQSLAGPVTTAAPPCGGSGCAVFVVGPSANGPSSFWAGGNAWINSHGGLLTIALAAAGVGLVAGVAIGLARQAPPASPPGSGPAKDDEPDGEPASKHADPLEDVL
jgi:hypothetical protein